MNAVTDVQLRQNINRTLAFGFFQVFLVIMPVVVPFFESRGLTMQQIFLLQALFARGRARHGNSVGLCGGHARTSRHVARRQRLHRARPFDAVVRGRVRRDSRCSKCASASASSLVSGTDLAILYDSEAALGHDAGRRQELVGRLFTMHTASEALARRVVQRADDRGRCDLAVYVQVFVGWIPLLIALTLVEPPGERMDATNHVANMREIFEHLLKSGAVLRLTFVALAIWSLTTFYAVWLLQKLWQQQGVELSQFGYLWAIYMLVSAAAGRLALKAEDRLGTTTLLAFVGAMPVVGYRGARAVRHRRRICRGADVLRRARSWTRRVARCVQQAPAGTFRATANSLASFGFSAAFAVTGPFVGWTLDLWGMDVTLALLAVVSLVIFAALLLPLTLAVRTAAAAAVEPAVG